VEALMNRKKSIQTTSFHFDEMRHFVLEKLESHLPANLYYHNLAHTLSVESVATEIAKIEKMSTIEIFLIRTAALYHDIGFIHQHHENESFAVELAEKELPAFLYSNDEIQLICEMIHSTQSSNDAQNMYDKILSDADHDYFGREDYFEIANNLRNEMHLYSRTFDEKGWLTFQLNYLENKHVYLTESWKKKRTAGKQMNINKLKQQLNELIS
jgi:adenylate cyclase